jgi:hypothetical protein
MSKNEYNLKKSKSHPEWFKEYDFFDKSVYDIPETWRLKMIKKWFEEYGISYFKLLDIWDVKSIKKLIN